MSGFGLCAVVFLLAEVSPAVAQWTPSHVEITYIEGEVELDGRPSPPLKKLVPENSVIRTTQGRAEVHFGRGDTLFLGESSSIRVRRNLAMAGDEPEVLSGSAVVTTGGIGPSVTCVQGAQLSDAGTFRFDVHRVVDETFCRLKVYKGAAAVKMPSFIWVLTPGKTIDLNPSCGDHTPRNEFNMAEGDALDRWIHTRIEGLISPL
jgi:hypothetical protein